MKGKITFLSMAAALVALPLAKGQNYSCSILYPLPTPSGFQSSDVGLAGVSADQVVGFGATSGAQNEALLWTPAGVVNLNPTNLSGYSDSAAIGAGGTQQVGYAYSSAASSFHAVLWTGAADSAVDLNPTNLSNVVESHALYTNGTASRGWVHPHGY